MNRLKLVAVGASLAIAPLTMFAQGTPPAASTRVASASPAYPVAQPRDRTPSEWLRDPRVTRAQLDSVAAAVERGSPGVQGADGAVASAIRVRLREGDFPAGERLYLTLGGPVPFADTLLVRDG